MQRHILGIQPLGSPYKIIAADVNLSTSVSTLDIVLARAVILGNTATFPNGKLWEFVESDFVFADPLNPFFYQSNRVNNNISTNQTGQNFIGIKLGDVNNSWDANTPKMSATGEVKFLVDEYTVMPGDEILVPVKVKDFNNVAGYQFTLSWNPNVLSFVEVNSQSVNGHYGKLKTNEGLLTTSWNSETGDALTLNDEAVLFELNFSVTGETNSYSEIKIGSELTASEAYNDRLDLLTVIPTNGMVNVGDATGIFNSKSSIFNLKVQPNPFSTSTNIIFGLPRKETARIAVYNLQGKQIRYWQAEYEAGGHTIEWAGDDDAGNSLSKGLYYVMIMTKNFSKGMKVLIVR